MAAAAYRSGEKLVNETFPRLKPNTPPSMVKKIGKTTYLVWAHFSETSTKTMEDKIKQMLREEVCQMMADE